MSWLRKSSEWLGTIVDAASLLFALLIAGAVVWALVEVVVLPLLG